MSIKQHRKVKSKSQNKGKVMGNLGQKEDTGGVKGKKLKIKKNLSSWKW